MMASISWKSDAIIRITPRVLSEARSAAKLSQKQLAERLDRSPAYIKGIERGTQSVGRSDFMKIARGLRIEPGALFERIMNDADDAED